MKMQPQPSPQPPTAARFGGLDGLRAIAVGLVLVYHLFPDALPGGFLGVDVFFVISGFLITSLLLREHAKNKRIALADFWRRRARRLLPALALVILVSTALARAVGGDLLVGIGKQILGATFFVSNWVYIATGADYFARDNPEIFRNTWSLSIEEQFYILLPLLVLLLIRVRRKWLSVSLLATLAGLSAWRMMALSIAGADPTRIYFGSDSHVFGLLIGAAAAALLFRASPAPMQPVRGATQAAYIAVTVAGLGVLAWQAFTLREGSPESFQGGFQLATLVSVFTIIAVTRPGAWVGKVLDVQPLRWVGERSYGIYLWHWPLLIIFGAALEGTVAPWVVSLLTLAVTLAISALSFAFIEQPIRRLGLRESLAQLFRFRYPSARARAIGLSVFVILFLTVPLSINAVVNAPIMGSAEAAIARGQAVLDEQQASSSEGSATAAASSPDGTEKPGTDSSAGSGKTGPGKTEPPAPPVAPQGTDITAIGDSVMLASLPELNDTFPGITVDAAVSRGMGEGVSIAQQLADASSLRSVIVIGLATNGTVDDEQLTQIRSITGNRPLVFVNAYGERDWIPGVNGQLNAFAGAYHGVVISDWQGSVTGVPGALAGDGIHPNTSGGEIYAESLQRALDAAMQPSEAIGYSVPRR